MKHTYGIIILSVFLIIGIISQVHAGFVPGTIVRDSGTSPVQTCSKTGNDYKTAFSCSSTVCQTYNYGENSDCPGGCLGYDQVATTCQTYNNDATCKNYGQIMMQKCKGPSGQIEWILVGERCSDVKGRGWSNDGPPSYKTNYSNCIEYNDDATCNTWNYENGECNTYSSCRIAGNGCETWSQSSTSFTTSTYYDYNNDSNTYLLGDLITVPADHDILGDDIGNECSTEADGTNHTPASLLGTSTCDTGNGSYYRNAGSSGICNDFDSINTYLDSNTVDQLGAGIFNRNVLETRDTCTVEGRYAQLDNDGPTITSTYGSLQTDTTKWCNLNKYKGQSPFSGTYGSISNVNTPGCEYYNKNNGQDLVDNFEISVQDISGLSKVQVELGKCSAYYDFTSLALGDLINATNASSGVRSEYQSLVIKSGTDSVYGRSGIVSLKTLFGKTRLDDCLVEGENYLRVTADDAARDSNDAVTLSPNSNTLFDKSYAIRIDNSGPTFDVSSDFDFDTKFQKFPSSTFPSEFDQNNWEQTWYNETITGSFLLSDRVNSGESLCTQYTNVGIGTCPSSPGKVWNSPVLPDGTYAIYECDGIQITDASVCNFSCDAGYVLSTDGTTCEPIPVVYDWYDEGYAGGCLAGDEYKVVSCADITDSNNTTNIGSCNMTNLRSSLQAGEAIYDEANLTGSEPTLSIYRSCSNPFTLGTSELGGTDTLGN